MNKEQMIKSAARMNSFYGGGKGEGGGENDETKSEHKKRPQKEFVKNNKGKKTTRNGENIRSSFYK